MWLALKLFFSGAFEKGIKALSSGAEWLLKEWWRAPLILFALGFAVMAFIRVPALQREIAGLEASVAAEQSAHAGTVAAFLDATRQAEAEARDNALRVEREQEIITDATIQHLEGDLAALRARFDRLRAAASAAASGSASAVDLPGTGHAAGRIDPAAPDHHLRAAGALSAAVSCPIGLVCLTIDEAEAASEDAHRFNRLIDWVIAQSAIPFTPEPQP